jgi:hypothetical protein
MHLLAERFVNCFKYSVDFDLSYSRMKQYHSQLEIRGFKFLLSMIDSYYLCYIICIVVKYKKTWLLFSYSS